MLVPFVSAVQAGIFIGRGMQHRRMVTEINSAIAKDDILFLARTSGGDDDDNNDCSGFEKVTNENARSKMIQNQIKTERKNPPFLFPQTLIYSQMI